MISIIKYRQRGSPTKIFFRLLIAGYIHYIYIFFGDAIGNSVKSPNRLILVLFNPSKSLRLLRCPRRSEFRSTFGCLLGYPSTDSVPLDLPSSYVDSNSARSRNNFANCADVLIHPLFLDLCRQTSSSPRRRDETESLNVPDDFSPTSRCCDDDYRLSFPRRLSRPRKIFDKRTSFAGGSILSDTNGKPCGYPSMAAGPAAILAFIFSFL